MGRRVLFWGRFDHGYSKTRVNAAAFRALGWEVDYFDVKWCCRLGDVEAFFRGLDRRPRPDLVLVPVCRQRDIAAACRWAHKRGIKVLFDPTSCHVDFAAEYLDVPREKMTPLFTGTDEEVFKPVEGECKVESEKCKVESGMQLSTFNSQLSTFKVLYHGAYLPLHGTEVIVEAARMTQDLPIQWDFLGWGAYKASTEAKAAGLKNVRFLEKVPYVKVPEVICAHDIVLGVFGTTAKAARVIGNKVYECMACGRPTINEFCTGYPPSAKDCKAIKFIPPGDPAALVKAVEEYRADWANKEMYFREARAFFERELSMKVVTAQLADILKRMGVS